MYVQALHIVRGIKRINSGARGTFSMSCRVIGGCGRMRAHCLHAVPWITLHRLSLVLALRQVMGPSSSLRHHVRVVHVSACPAVSTPRGRAEKQRCYNVDPAHDYQKFRSWKRKFEYFFQFNIIGLSPAFARPGVTSATGLETISYSQKRYVKTNMASVK